MMAANTRPGHPGSCHLADAYVAIAPWPLGPLTMPPAARQRSRGGRRRRVWGSMDGVERRSTRCDLAGAASSAVNELANQ